MEEGEEEGWAVIKGAGLKWVNREGIKRRVRVKGAIALWQTYCSVNGNTYVNKESPEMGWRGSSLRDMSFCQEPWQPSPPAPAPPQVTPFLQRLVPPLRAGHWQRGAPNPAMAQGIPREALRVNKLLCMLRIQPFLLMGSVHAGFCGQWHRENYSDLVLMLRCVFLAQQHPAQVQGMALPNMSGSPPTWAIPHCSAFTPAPA